MGKDRFNTRASYDSTFKYGEYLAPMTSTKRQVSSKQIEIIKEMRKSKKLNNWEKQFLKDVSLLPSFSTKVKDKLNLIYVKVKGKKLT
tara:strand:+ start:1382 stop:1645 length:264 start_codon:yes stop_codon:yes gene_type:complete